MKMTQQQLIEQEYASLKKIAVKNVEALSVNTSTAQATLSVRKKSGMKKMILFKTSWSQVVSVEVKDVALSSATKLQTLPK